jgi:hypothetical protein
LNHDFHAADVGPSREKQDIHRSIALLTGKEVTGLIATFRSQVDPVIVVRPGACIVRHGFQGRKRGNRM